MVLSFHSHSGQFCHHGHGTLESVINKAIELKYIALGLSEHLPRETQLQLYPEELELNLIPKDLDNQFKNYLLAAKSLKKSNQDIILLVGAETEFIDDSSIKICNLYRPELDYIVGSVHHVNQIPIDFDEKMYLQALESSGSIEKLYEDYYDTQFEMLNKLKPEVIGHFDLIRIFNKNRNFKVNEVIFNKIKRNVDFIASYNGLVEINSRALKKGILTPYPDKFIIEYMKSKNIRFTLSDDSHGPKDIALYYKELNQYLHDMNINDIYYLISKELTDNNNIIKPVDYSFSFVSVNKIELKDFDKWIINL